MKHPRNILGMTLAAVLAIPCIAIAERTVTLLDGNDWTLDGIPVLVPHCWNKIDAADGNPSLADDTKIYSAVPANSYLRATRTYSRPLPDAMPGRRYFIRCEGASQKAKVRVNGVEIGSHKGSFTAFCYEATAAMKPTGNRLEIEVSNEYDPTIPPASGGFNIHGGLYRSVWLIETDPVCIDPTIHGGPGVRVFPSMDGTVRVEADVSGADDATVNWEPKKVENPRLWSPEEPHVYTVTVTVSKAGWSDTVVQPFGFRTTEIREDGFYLNGVKRKVRGVSRHQDLEGMGWEVSDAQEELDIRLVKTIGADGLRLAHYPQRENIYSLCDRYGLMVWSEIPVVNELGGAEFMENAKEMLREMIAQHRNHPCVCWWGMWNEIFNMKKPNPAWASEANQFAPLAAELDPSRPIVAGSWKEVGRVSQETLAVLHRSVPHICYNIYPGWYVKPDISNSLKREVDVFLTKNDISITALSEYGAGGSVHQHQNPPQKPKTTAMFHPEEWQTKQLTDDLRDITADGRLWGSFVWAMFDFSHDGRREGDRYGILDKGIVTRDRAILKDAFYLYKANWNPEPLLHLCSKRMTTTTNAVCEVMCFSNVGDVALKVNGETVATATPDSVKSVTFAGVRLAPGANEIVVEAGGLRDTARWTLLAGGRACGPEAWDPEARRKSAAAAPRDFPVVGTGGTAVQAAIDVAAAAGGGRVVLSNGVYESGTIYLKSNVELHLEEGAVLRGAADSAAYDDVDDPRIGRVPERSRKAFIVCFDGENVAITGKGTIDGQGVAFYDAFSAAGRRHFAKPAAPRPRMVQFFNCRRVRFEGATFKDSPGWTFWLRACEDVEVSSINVEGDQRMINNDGLHIDACRNVRVGDSRFKTGDDCIVMRANINKDGGGALCENLVVSNCFLDSSCQAVRLGCPSDGMIRHARFSDLTIRGVNGIISKHPLRYLHTGSCGGFAMEDMVFERCDIETERCPILFDVDPGIKLASFGHTVFRDMKVKGGRSVVLRGNAASPLENVAFERCVFDCAVSNAFDIHAVKNLSFGGTTVSTALPGAESFDWNWQGGCWEEDMCVDSTDGGQNVVMGVLRGRGRKWWLARHEATLETIKNGPGHYDIVMVGDSITDLWQHPRPGGKEVAERYFNKWNMLNLGVMGDLVENIIWRLENGEADGYAAKVVMVLAGTNNIGKGASGEEVAAATERLVELLRTKHPEARIVLLPILPRDDRRKGPAAAARIATANELSRKLVDGKTVFGLDFSQRLLGEDGAIDAALFKKDRLHLNASGYGVWAGAALPVFEKLLATPPPPLLPEEPISEKHVDKTLKGETQP